MKLLTQSIRRVQGSVRRPLVEERRHIGRIPTTAAPVRAVPENVIGRNNVDQWVAYVGQRVSKRMLGKNVVGQPKPTLKKRGFLVVRGNKPGLLVHPVLWDGQDIYTRDNLYGKLSTINTAAPALKAEIVDLSTLMLRAKAAKMPLKEVKALEDEKHYKVALLNNFGEAYVAGLTIEHGKIRVLNMEHRAKHNKVRVQFEFVRDLTESVSKFLSQVKTA